MGIYNLNMDIAVSRQEVLANVTGKPRKYCLDCKVYFEPTTLEADPHGSHYTWFLPLEKRDFDQWIHRIRNKDEDVWGYIMDEDGVSSRPFCPHKFQLQIHP